MMEERLTRCSCSAQLVSFLHSTWKRRRQKEYSMKFISRARKALWKKTLTYLYKQLPNIISTGTLSLLLSLSLLSNGHRLTVANGLQAQTIDPLTFGAEADSYVKQSSPSS